MKISYIESNCGTHNFEVETEDFKSIVKIADHDEMVYVRQFFPSKNGEKLNSFHFKTELENTVVNYYKFNYQNKLTRKRKH